MEILKWNKDLQQWEIPETGDKFVADYIDPTFATDVEITDPAAGIILASPTKRWRITIDDSGVLTPTEIIPM